MQIKWLQKFVRFSFAEWDLNALLPYSDVPVFSQKLH